MKMNVIIISTLMSIYSNANFLSAESSYLYSPSLKRQGALLDFDITWKSVFGDKISGNGFDLTWSHNSSYISNINIRTYHDSQVDVYSAIGYDIIREVKPVCLKSIFATSISYKSMNQHDQSDFSDAKGDFYFESMALNAEGIVENSKVFKYNNSESFVEDSWDYDNDKFKNNISYLNESEVFQSGIDKATYLSFGVEKMEVVFDVTKAKEAFYDEKATEKVLIMTELVNSISYALFDSYFSNSFQGQALRNKVQSRLQESNLVNKIIVIENIYNKLMYKTKERLKLADSSKYETQQLQQAYNDVLVKFDADIKATGSLDKRYQNLNDVVYNLSDIYDKISIEKNEMNYLRSVNCNSKPREVISSFLELYGESVVELNGNGWCSSRPSVYELAGKVDYEDGIVLVSVDEGDSEEVLVRNGKFRYFTKDITNGRHRIRVTTEFGVSKEHSVEVKWLSCRGMTLGG